MITVLQGDWVEQLATLPDASVHCCVTSPPYWGLRDYGVSGQLGIEKTPEEYVAKMVAGFREVRRVLRDDGTAWVNLGDCYATGAGKVGNCPGGGEQGSRWKERGAQTQANRMPIPGLKPKDLVGIPWRVAFALQADGWYLRSDIIWHKPNPMPESVTDRPTKSHEYIFLMSKAERYYYDAEAIKEDAESFGKTNGAACLRGQGHFRQSAGGPANRPGRDMREIGRGTTRNRRTVWTVASAAFSGDVSYGKCRIASPDCPVHDYQADRARALEYGEQLIAFESGRSPDTDARPFEVREGAFVAIPLGRCASLFDSTSAICRSTGNHKTATESAQGVIFFGISPDHIECIPQVRRSVSKFFRKHASRTSEDAFEDGRHSDPLEQTEGRIVGILTFVEIPHSCCCEYSGTVEKRQDHFACFPPDLIKPCILAGTSAKGCCPKCGAPWERIIERMGLISSGPNGIAHKPRSIHRKPNATPLEIRPKDGYGDLPKWDNVTTGWQPTCECGEQRTVPATVLDPFGGSGTTGQVALELGRKAVLIELNPEYIELINHRTNVTPGLAIA